MTKEEEIVRNVFDSYIRDLKAISTKKDRPTFDMLEKVKNKAIKALEQENKGKVAERIEYGTDGHIYKMSISNGTEFEKQKKKSLEQQSCDDCVSRQAVDLLCFKYLKPNNDDNVAFYEHFCDLPPVTPTQRWIPVSERLPEVGEKVLCQCQANIYDVLKLTVDGWYYDKNHCYMSGFVVAWQPLPKPYEEKRGNNVD